MRGRGRTRFRSLAPQAPRPPAGMDAAVRPTVLLTGEYIAAIEREPERWCW